MLNLLQHELDDVKAALKDWCYYEFCDDAPFIQGLVHRAMLREAVDRIYEVCQTAHARELRKSASIVTVAEELDINVWYARHSKRCPTCGTDLSVLDPAANLAPHWERRCKEFGWGDPAQKS